MYLNNLKSYNLFNLNLINAFIFYQLKALEINLTSFVRVFAYITLFSFSFVFVYLLSTYLP